MPCILERGVGLRAQIQALLLEGRADYDLEIVDGRLVATFTDTSERSRPLVVKYRWSQDKCPSPAEPAQRADVDLVFYNRFAALPSR